MAEDKPNGKDMALRYVVYGLALSIVVAVGSLLSTSATASMRWGSLEATVMALREEVREGFRRQEQGFQDALRRQDARIDRLEQRLENKPK